MAPIIRRKGTLAGMVRLSFLDIQRVSKANMMTIAHFCPALFVSSTIASFLFSARCGLMSIASFFLCCGGSAPPALSNRSLRRHWGQSTDRNLWSALSSGCCFSDAEKYKRLLEFLPSSHSNHYFSSRCYSYDLCTAFLDKHRGYKLFGFRHTPFGALIRPLYTHCAQLVRHIQHSAPLADYRLCQWYISGTLVPPLVMFPSHSSLLPRGLGGLPRHGRMGPGTESA